MIKFAKSEASELPLLRASGRLEYDWSVRQPDRTLKSQTQASFAVRQVGLLSLPVRLRAESIHRAERESHREDGSSGQGRERDRVSEVLIVLLLRLLRYYSATGENGTLCRRAQPLRLEYRVRPAQAAPETRVKSYSAVCPSPQQLTVMYRPVKARGEAERRFWISALELP